MTSKHIDADDIDASFKDGVLKLIIPKSIETKAKTVDVKAERLCALAGPERTGRARRSEGAQQELNHERAKADQPGPLA